MEGELLDTTKPKKKIGSAVLTKIMRQDDLGKTTKIRVAQTRSFQADPDPALHFTANPDPGSQAFITKNVRCRGRSVIDVQYFVLKRSTQDIKIIPECCRFKSLDADPVSPKIRMMRILLFLRKQFFLCFRTPLLECLNDGLKIAKSFLFLNLGGIGLRGI